MKRLSPRARKVLRYSVTAIVIVVVGILFGRALAENWAQVQEARLRFSWLMVLAVLAFAVAVPLSGLLWGSIVNRLSPGPRAHVGESIAVHCASWLLKYIPGQVGSLVNKVLWGQRKGLGRTLVGITFIYENVFMVLAAIVPSVVILMVSLGAEIIGANIGTLILPLVAIVPLLLISNRWVFRRLLAPVARRAFKQELPPEYFLTTPQTLRYQLLFVGPRLLNGLGFVLVVASITDVEPGAWIPLAAAYMLAGAAGILAILVPSGLGVREAVIVLFAAQYMPLAQAIVASLLARLLSTIADAVVALVYVALRHTMPRDPLEEKAPA
ncbi:lysylphosphatidylglycerol synthase domain-containing protein [Homoserinibacter sp. YIM 151385]|uniref:lysylphosphatidylglycerol synthase domain-containing protein n=1 Tax=Homoserinibacter sp. YIM 151385 TaxID=2985506 RepID=UPI0022F0C77C|nr:lysylphosphatidylglycerol synthase domain-containing protein [Homoserinibacter sp. YIM 151385]WBU37768.1 hypothetical protein OF852_12740 [Homoserinibacter sp. YIM 151385]